MTTHIATNTRGFYRYTETLTGRCTICDTLTATECVCGRCLDMPHPHSDDDGPQGLYDLLAF